MTATVDIDLREETAERAPTAAPQPPRSKPSAPPKPMTPRRAGVLTAAWLVALVMGMGLVMYGFGPLTASRNQRALMSQYRSAIDKASKERFGLPGVTTVTKAPEPGDPVAILQISAISMQEVVVEGVASSDTQSAPGHVPGTAGVGQPGNAVVVGRRTAFGGPFKHLNHLDPSDVIVATTTQGQTVYTIDSVEKVDLTANGALDKLYGPTKGDQLTLVTSASAAPWNRSEAQVVVATMSTKPFEPTPQGGRTDATTGTRGDDNAVAAVILALLVYGLAMGGVILLYRRLPPRTAYLLTIAPVLALTVIAAETLSRVFPAWM
jgi:sortase A